MSNLDRVARSLQRLQQGIETYKGVESELLQYLTPQDAGEWFRLIPPEILQKLKVKVASMPTTDEGWGELCFVASYCVRGGEDTYKKIKEAETIAQKQFRRGVETFRAYSMQGQVNGFETR